eukprot:1303448-Pleurochrysis_carterae.AAC.4
MLWQGYFQPTATRSLASTSAPLATRAAAPTVLMKLHETAPTTVPTPTADSSSTTLATETTSTGALQPAVCSRTARYLTSTKDTRRWQTDHKAAACVCIELSYEACGKVR